MNIPFTFADFIQESKQSIDKDGFLLCRDVPVARTGQQLYGPGETPIEVGDGMVVRIDREPEEVFHPDTLASLQGVPVVNDHPVDGEGNRCDVTPDNWRQIACGHVENPRRGDGEMGDFIIADLRIHDRDAIGLIKSGKRQVSAGYDADYEQLGPGHGRQRNIRCNHMAIVDAARCGPICAIGDGATKEVDMTLADRLRKAFTTKDAAALEAALAEVKTTDEEKKPEEEENGKAVHIHVHPGDNAKPRDEEKKDEKTEDAHDLENEELWEAIEALERAAVMGGNGNDAKFKPRDGWPHRDARRKRMGIDAKPRDEKKEEETEDEEILHEWQMEAPPGAQVVKGVHDSAFMADSWAETCSLAEIMVPGIRLPVFDKAMEPKKSYDAICDFRRRTLDLFYVHPEGRELIDEQTNGRFSTAKELTCGAVRQLFRTVGIVKRRMNNRAGVGDFRAPNQNAPVVAAGGATSLKEYQEQLNKFYGGTKQ